MNTLKDLMNQSFDAHGERTAIRVLGGGDGGGNLNYQPTSYDELRRQRDALAAGLHGMGLHRGQRIGVMTDSSVPALLLFLAADMLGLSTVPMCPKASIEILTYYLDHSAVEVLFLDTRAKQVVQTFISSLRRAPRLVVTDDDTEGEFSWRALTSATGPLPEVEVRSGDESKLVYTSGSSGLPKGVIQTHANIVANVEGVWNLISRSEDIRFFKMAPDYHSMGILNIYFPLAKGWSLDLARSPDRVLSDIRLSEPDCFLTVPLVLDKVYGNVRREIDAGGIKGRLLSRAVGAKQRLARGSASVSDRLLHGVLGRRVIGVIREKLARRLGPNLKLLIVGSAKADAAALDFFHEVLDITTFEGYGATECAPLIAANHLGGRKSGTVGRPLFEVRLVNEAGAEVARGIPDTGEYSGAGAVGELWVCGGNVMRGYLDDAEQTARVLVVDEDAKTWYRTGDLFSMDGDGFLTFQGRVGRQFKLANGEFVNPEQLEHVFARVALIEHVVVVGHADSDSPVVLVTVNVDEASKLGGLGELPSDEDELRADPRVADHIRRLLLREADEAGLPAHERPNVVIVLPQALSEETGTLTTGLRKIVPAAVLKRFSDLVATAVAS